MLVTLLTTPVYLLSVTITAVTVSRSSPVCLCHRVVSGPFVAAANVENILLFISASDFLCYSLPFLVTSLFVVFLASIQQGGDVWRDGE